MKPVECPRCGVTITSPESHNIAEGTCKPRSNGGSGSNIAQQPQLEMPCESDYLLWCSMRGYNVAHAADIFRYIAQHIKRVR